MTLGPWTAVLVWGHLSKLEGSHYVYDKIFMVPPRPFLDLRCVWISQFYLQITSLAVLGPYLHSGPRNIAICKALVDRHQSSDNLFLNGLLLEGLVWLWLLLLMTAWVDMLRWKRCWPDILYLRKCVNTVLWSLSRFYHIPCNLTLMEETGINLLGKEVFFYPLAIYLFINKHLSICKVNKCINMQSALW